MEVLCTYFPKMWQPTQVTRSVDTQYGQLSPQEQKTVDAIVRARYSTQPPQDAFIHSHLHFFSHPNDTIHVNLIAANTLYLLF